MVLVSPVLVLLAIFVFIKMGRPVLFRQARPGLRENADRVTSLGKFLRNTSLDELPELLNVIKGDMSLIGPRPLLMQYLDRYTLEQARRHEVKPGITGWAQVNGRNTITWEQKFEHDVWYVDHQSFSLDMKIIAMTIWKILKREGISQPGHATAQQFRGTCKTHAKAQRR
jgi:lipopolysaccharide/colanic/teichoic acid biosynthesis glycosyltransferase